MALCRYPRLSHENTLRESGRNPEIVRLSRYGAVVPPWLGVQTWHRRKNPPTLMRFTPAVYGGILSLNQDRPSQRERTENSSRSGDMLTPWAIIFESEIVMPGGPGLENKLATALEAGPAGSVRRQRVLAEASDKPIQAAKSVALLCELVREELIGEKSDTDLAQSSAVLEQGVEALSRTGYNHPETSTQVGHTLFQVAQTADTIGPRRAAVRALETIAADRIGYPLADAVIFTDTAPATSSVGLEDSESAVTEEEAATIEEQGRVAWAAIRLNSGAVPSDDESLEPVFSPRSARSRAIIQLAIDSAVGRMDSASWLSALDRDGLNQILPDLGRLSATDHDERSIEKLQTELEVIKRVAEMPSLGAARVDHLANVIDCELNRDHSEVDKLVGKESLSQDVQREALAALHTVADERPHTLREAAPTLRRLILEGQHESLRTRAAEILEQAAENGLWNFQGEADVLMTALESDSEYLTPHIVRAFEAGLATSEDSAPLVIEGLREVAQDGSSNEFGRSDAEAAVAAIGTVARQHPDLGAQALATLITEEDRAVRLRAVRYLGEVPRALDQVRGDVEEAVRHLVESEIYDDRSGSEFSVPGSTASEPNPVGDAIANVLDQDERLRAIVLEDLLEALGEESADTGTTLEILREVGFGEENPELRREFVDELWECFIRSSDREKNTIVEIFADRAATGTDGGPRIADWIRRALEDDSERTRAKTADTIAQLASENVTISPDIIEPLQNRLRQDESEEVRSSALEGLVQVGIHEGTTREIALHAIHHALRDRDDGVRASALWQCVELGEAEPSHIPHIIQEILATADRDSRDADFRFIDDDYDAVVSRLIEVDSTCREFLIQEIFHQLEKDPSTRQASISILAAVDYEALSERSALTEALANTVGDPNLDEWSSEVNSRRFFQRRNRILERLVESDKPLATALFQQLCVKLQSSSALTRLRAAELLPRIAPDVNETVLRSIEDLVQNSDTNWYVRSKANQALSELNSWSEDDIDLYVNISEALSSQRSMVRDEAMQVVQERVQRGDDQLLSEDTVQQLLDQYESESPSGTELVSVLSMITYEAPRTIDHNLEPVVDMLVDYAVWAYAARPVYLDGPGAVATLDRLLTESAAAREYAIDELVRVIEGKRVEDPWDPQRAAWVLLDLTDAAPTAIADRSSRLVTVLEDGHSVAQKQIADLLHEMVMRSDVELTVDPERIRTIVSDVDKETQGDSMVATLIDVLLRL